MLETYGNGDGNSTFNLPDYREVALVGIGSNGTDIIDNTQEHDKYKMGEFKDDQMQRITGQIYPVSTGREGYSVGTAGAFGASELDKGEENGSGAYRIYLSIDSSKVTRTGYNRTTGQWDGPNITRGRRKGVMYLIKVL